MPASLHQGRLGRKTTLCVLNPKAISVSELYGVLDKDTRDWTDGLLSNVFRCAACQPPSGGGHRNPIQQGALQGALHLSA